MQELINIPAYWRNTQVRPRGFTELCDMVETHGKITGIWMWEQWDPKTGEVRKRDVNRNVVTDNGAIQIFQAAIANAVPAAVFNNIYINNNSASTTLSGTGFSNAQVIATGANMPVNAAPAALPLNYPAPANAVVQQITVGYGSGTTQIWSVNLATIYGATSFNIVGQTTNAAYAGGTAVVPLPNVAENPTNTNLKINQTNAVVEMYSSTGGGVCTYTYTATTGAGNRSVLMTFVFKTAANGGSTPIGRQSCRSLVA
jgi:hypothetical protein